MRPDQAAYLLRHPEEAGLPLLVDDQTLRLRIVHEPSFAPNRSWSVYQATDPSAPVSILRLTWDPPTIVHALAYLPPERLEPLLVEGASLAIPAEVPARSGIDGEIWTVERGDLRLTWWCAGPPGWKAIFDWTKKTAALLDSTAFP